MHAIFWPRGTPPECLIDYFPDDWLLIVDESHVTCSQLQAMYNGDQAQKKVLIDHGFSFPVADNRPLKVRVLGQARQTLLPQPLQVIGRFKLVVNSGGAGDPSNWSARPDSGG